MAEGWKCVWFDTPWYKGMENSLDIPIGQFQNDGFLNVTQRKKKNTEAYKNSMACSRNYIQITKP